MHGDIDIACWSESFILRNIIIRRDRVFQICNSLICTFFVLFIVKENI